MKRFFVLFLLFFVANSWAGVCMDYFRLSSGLYAGFSHNGVQLDSANWDVVDGGDNMFYSYDSQGHLTRIKRTTQSIYQSFGIDYVIPDSAAYHPVDHDNVPMEEITNWITYKFENNKLNVAYKFEDEYGCTLDTLIDAPDTLSYVSHGFYEGEPSSLSKMILIDNHDGTLNYSSVYEDDEDGVMTADVSCVETNNSCECFDVSDGESTNDAQRLLVRQTFANGVYVDSAYSKGRAIYAFYFTKDGATTSTKNMRKPSVQTIKKVRIFDLLGRRQRIKRNM